MNIKKNYENQEYIKIFSNFTFLETETEDKHKNVRFLSDIKTDNMIPENKIYKYLYLFPVTRMYFYAIKDDVERPGECFIGIDKIRYHFFNNNKAGIMRANENKIDKKYLFTEI